MESAVLESPHAETTPRTVQESALVACHAVAGDQAVLTAERLAQLALDRVEALQTSLPGSGDRSWVAQMQAALVARDQAASRHHFLAALEAGEPTDPIPSPDVSAELVARVVRARGPAAFARLLSQGAAFASNLTEQAAGVGRRLEGIRGEYQAGRLTMSEFLEAFGREDKDRAQREARAAELRKAVDMVQAVLQRDIGDVLGDVSVVRTGIREAR
jgi:hypothetical protein